MIDEWVVPGILHAGAARQRDLLAVDEHRQMDVVVELVLERAFAIDAVDLLAVTAGRGIALGEHVGPDGRSDDELDRRRRRRGRDARAGLWYGRDRTRRRSGAASRCRRCDDGTKGH